MPLPHLHVTAGMIFRDHRVLISRRPAKSPLGGLWEFPGGKIEEGETLEECLAREILEELAVEVVVGELYVQVYHTYETFSLTLYVFPCLLKEGEPQPIGVAEFRWVRLEELEQFVFPPADREVLDHIKRHPPRPPI